MVAQVWSVVDQGFVDRTFNNNDWMKLRQKAVKRDFASRDEAYEVITNELLKPLGDQYTRFIDPVKYEALRTSIVGGKGQDVSGIGVTLSIDKKAQRVKIVDVVEGSPAAQAELVREALITEVNKVRTDDGKVEPGAVRRGKVLGKSLAVRRSVQVEFRLVNVVVVALGVVQVSRVKARGDLDARTCVRRQAFSLHVTDSYN